MSKNFLPFVCKWFGTHPHPQYFETKEKLRDHIFQHDINSCKRSFPIDPLYLCPWENCNKDQSSVTQLKEHLHRHIQQKPFKCPICNRSRFDSPDALSQHLIINHNDSVVNLDTDDDTLYEELSLGKAKDKNDVRVKKEASKDEKDEIIPTSNTAKLSYRDVLIKGKVNENENMEDLRRYKHELDLRRYKHEKAVQDLAYRGIKAISLLPKRRPVRKYDFDNKNYDNLPDAPRRKLSEDERDKLMWEAMCKYYKGTEAGEYFNKAFELIKRGP